MWKWHQNSLNLNMLHYSDAIVSAMASQITGVLIVHSTVCSGADGRKHKKFRVTGLCEGNSPVTCEIPTQRAREPENVSIWWHHDVKSYLLDIA